MTIDEALMEEARDLHDSLVERGLLKHAQAVQNALYEATIDFETETTFGEDGMSRCEDAIERVTSSMTAFSSDGVCGDDILSFFEGNSDEIDAIRTASENGPSFVKTKCAEILDDLREIVTIARQASGGKVLQAASLRLSSIAERNAR